MTRDEALTLVKEQVPQANLVKHCIATEIIMAALAQRLGLGPEDVERWAVAGLLHDLDYAETAENPARHGLVSAELLKGRVDDEIMHAILGHADKVERETPMDHALWCADPTTGFITAAALVRPDRNLGNVELKSLKKRWKEGAFAKGANREQMAGCEVLGIERDDFLDLALSAMKARKDEIGL